MLCLFFALASIPIKTSAQSPPCGVELPEGWIGALLEEVPIIEQSAAQRGTVSTVDIPVRFTIFQGPGGFANMSNFQLNIDSALAKLNAAFQPSGLHFVQCGPANEVWDNRNTSAGHSPDTFLPLFSYTSGAIEVTTRLSLVNSTAAIPAPAFQENNPNWVPLYTENSNWVNMAYFESADFVHEVGHHFGLLHTHQPQKTYIVPAQGDTTQDYPYKVIIPNSIPPQPQPWWWGRELVIRNDNPNKTFPFTNWIMAGDLVQDTPADCDGGINPQLYPGCPSSAQDSLTCEFNSQLTYADYNGDAIYPPPAGLSLGRNYMSYWKKSCLNELTQKQLDRALHYYETVRKPQYAMAKCGNFADKVEFEGGIKGLHNVTIRVRHPQDDRKCNVTTNQDGHFDGILHLDTLTAYVYHNGKKSTLAYPNDPLRVHYDHTNCEWLRGVSTLDLLEIQKHILGLSLFTSGYAKIAADANKSNSVTTFDIVELRKLILGIYDKLPAHDQPWRFVPEFVPQDYATPFDYSPFSLSIGGSISADYLEQGWQFSLPDALNGKKGFDGIKIGDVNSSWLSPLIPQCPNESEPLIDEGEKPTLAVSSTSLAQNDTVALTFKATNFQEVEAYQLGIQLPYDYFEVLDVVNTALPAYTKVDNFGLTHLEDDAVRTLWFDEDGNTQTLQDSATLFSIVVRAKQTVSNLQSLLKLDNSILFNQFWRDVSVIADPVSLIVIVEEDPGERSNGGASPALTQRYDEVLRCYPNPFKNNIQLIFVHGEQPAQADLKITNAQGAEVYCQTVSLLAGENTMDINALRDVPAGLYWIALTVQGKIFTTKVVKE